MTRYGFLYGPETSGDDPRQVDVNISEWQRGTNDDILETVGLDTCIGIAISDPQSRVGHLGHFADPLIEEAEVDEMLASAVQNIPDPGRLLVWVRGGADPAPKDSTAHTQLSKNLALRRIEAFGLHRPDVKWGDDSGVCFNMRLDCATGMCAIEEIAWQ